MDLSFNGGSSRQRQWVQDAIDKLSYPFDTLSVTVIVQWGVPPCAGHDAFACTVESGGVATITIRDSLDSQNTLDADVESFYRETVAHELGHVVMFTKLPDPAVACPYFYKLKTGNAPIYGTAADLNPSGAAWEDKIQEAMAETFKDAFLPEHLRVYDNRTNWQLDQSHYSAFMAAIGLAGEAGTAGFHQAGLFEPVSLEYEVEYNPPGNGAGMYIAASPAIPNSIPDDAVLTLTDWAHVDVTASGYTTSLVSGFYTYLIEAPAGHGPPTHLADDWNVETSVASQGFTVVEGAEWDQVFPWHPDSSKERYVLVRQIWAGAAASTELSTVVSMGAIETRPLLQADKTGAASSPDPPPWPYTPPELGAGEGDWGVVRFRTYG